MSSRQSVQAAVLCALVVVLLAIAWPASREQSRETDDPRWKIELPEVESLAETSWATVNAFPKLRFFEPVALVAARDGSNRLFVLERRGVVQVFQNDTQAATKKVFVDFSDRTWRLTTVEDGALGLALHPEFGRPDSPNRGYVYVFYTAKEGETRYDRLSRFTVPDGSDVCDPDSELILIDQLDDHRWHNGGCLVFGPDGFLYVSLGDEGGTADEFENSQRIDRDFFCGVLRIDVDQRGGSVSHPPVNRAETARTAKHYFIPTDNPFVGQPGVLEEFYAHGFRNPHRMSFDPETGALWLGDVGDADREEVNLIRPGGNYGWAYDEAGARYSKARFEKKPRSPIGVETPPVYSYPHTDLNYAVIGGHVYRGRRYPELRGKYVYGDNVSGRIWALEVREGKAVAQTELCRLTWSAFFGLSSFGVDAQGEIFLLVLGAQEKEGGRILKLVPSEEATIPMPRLLSETGYFTDLRTLQAAPEFVAYDVQSPLWSDGASKRRWVAVRGGKVDYATDGPLGFPPGTVFLKHFEFPGRRLETRVTILDEELGLIVATYKWNDAQTDAELLSSGLREAGWTYPSRAECFMCHNENAGFVLGPSVRQLGRAQLEQWERADLLREPLPKSTPEALVAVDDPTASLEARARSYLHANCSHCHRPGGVMAQFDARYQTPLPRQGLIHGRLYHVDKKSRSRRLVTPGRSSRSAILRRMDSSQHRMPPLGVSVPDEAALRVLAEWIDGLPKNWRAAAAGD